MELKKVISLPKTNWRNVLLWNTELPDDSINVDYWLGYAEDDGFGKDEKLFQWETSWEVPFSNSIHDWNKNSDHKVEVKYFPQILKFVKEFLKIHGKINANIVQAYISQEVFK
jgi:hypothetical protein